MSWSSRRAHDIWQSSDLWLWGLKFLCEYCNIIIIFDDSEKKIHLPNDPISLLINSITGRVPRYKQHEREVVYQDVREKLFGIRLQGGVSEPSGIPQGLPHYLASHFRVHYKPSDLFWNCLLSIQYTVYCSTSLYEAWACTITHFWRCFINHGRVRLLKKYTNGYCMKFSLLYVVVTKGWPQTSSLKSSRRVGSPETNYC